MAAPTSAAGSYKIPEWSVKNKEIFLAAQKGEILARTLLPSTTLMGQGRSNAPPMQAAVGMATLVEERKCAIVPPSSPAPAAYFRDVANHPDVLSTIISTARHTVGFSPDLTGASLTEEQAAEYIRTLNAFIAELDRYFAYVEFVGSSTKVVETKNIDCLSLMNKIASIIAIHMNVPAFGSPFEDLKERVSTLVKAALSFVSVGEGKSSNTGFELVILPASNEVGNDNPIPPNPTSMIGFTRATIGEGVDGKSSIMDDAIIIQTLEYRLRSSRIIADAESLMGTSIIGTKALASFINGPIQDTTCD